MTEYMEDEVDINYIFGLFHDGDVKLDETSLVENDPDYAWTLFMEDFGWDIRHSRGDLENPYVKLICFDDPTLIDHPERVEKCQDVREDGRKLCSADKSDAEDVARLKSCPDYNPEDEPVPNSPNIYCQHCWAVGDYSVCELKPKEVGK